MESQRLLSILKDFTDSDIGLDDDGEAEPIAEFDDESGEETGEVEYEHSNEASNESGSDKSIEFEDDIETRFA